MANQPLPANAVAAIRVSTEKQGRDGDSPEDQQDKIDRFALARGIVVKEHFKFLESGSKAKQPMQVAIDYCKKPENNIRFFIIKSIDRFTRGGSRMYEDLKEQLDDCGVTLIDTYGVISSEKVNTLDHLGFTYKWSEFSPSKKTEILEAERAKDELRDIMTRMVGAEIRYTQMGYWMRQPPYGYASQKVETRNGKRTVLVPYAKEAKLIRKLFELRADGIHNDKEIAEELNERGFKSRTTLRRDNHDRTKIIGERGGKPLTAKDVGEYVSNPIYVGIICEKWTNNKPIRGQFKGLVSLELFNKANKGKWTIVENGEEIKLLKRKPAARYLNAYGAKSAEFAYRKFITCPDCKHILLGSASKGKMGKYYPAYHCNKQGHYFRVPKQEFEDTVKSFVKNIRLTPEYVEAVTKAVIDEWDKRQKEEQDKQVDYDARITELQKEAQAIVDRIKILSSEIAIKSMEDELVKIDAQMSVLRTEKENAAKQEPLNIRSIIGNIKYFMEHLEELLLQQSNPVAKAEYFGVLFDQLPTYAEIKYGTQNPTGLTGINELFKLKNCPQGALVRPAGFEPTTFCSEDRRSNPLSYGRILHI